MGSDSATGIHSIMETNNEYITTYFDVIQNGSILDVFKINANYGMLTKIDFQISFFGRLYYTFGYFLIGLWLGKTGIFNQLAAFSKKIKTFMLWSLVVLLLSLVAMIATFATMPQPIDNSSWQFVFAMNFMDWFNIAMTSIILCGFLLLYQSVIGTFIFFGWGLGYLGQIRALFLFVMALVLIAIQTILSKYWLQKFKYGPLEWLWRSGTYLKWQPMLKNKELNS